MEYQQLIDAILVEAGFPDSKKCFVELQWVDAKESQKLNREFRNKNKPTDVLSFPLYSFSELKNLFSIPDTKYLIQNMQNRLQPILLGSIVLCREIIKKRAEAEAISTDERIAWSIRHGLKHLLGYDHNPDGSEWFPIVNGTYAKPL